MSEIEKIHRYIEKTAMPKALAIRSSMLYKEYTAIADSCMPCDGMFLAFSYGRAKGYRAAKAEARREKEVPLNE